MVCGIGSMHKPTGPELKEKFVGSYDWGWLCKPSWPFGKGSKNRRAPPFFPVDSQPGILVAIMMGLQHALAMVGGIITPPILVYRSTVPEGQADSDLEQYFISAALIVSGLTSLVQITRFGFKAPRFYHADRVFIGTGLISMMGTSFTFVPISQSSITTMLSDGDEWRVAYGRILGTTAVASLLELALSFCPPRLLRRLFPPIVSGTAVFLIGASLIGTGIKAWGGGAFCADNAKGLPAQELTDCFDSDGNRYPDGQCFQPQVIPDCDGNGEVLLPFGSAEYVGLGFSVFATLIVVELFGSPAMRNVQVVIGLVVGVIIALLAGIDGPKYITGDKIESAKSITFLWVETFPLGFYAPSILPLLIGFIVTTVESIGDITATVEASEMDIVGSDLYGRIQGGLTGDGIASLFASLATSLPNTTFSQNNGVISLTRCAARQAGLAAAGWLLCLGILSKIAAVFSSIPDCVLGGMTTFLFASVTISGIRIIVSTPGGIGRRERFILSIALGAGLGVTLVPGWTQNNLWPVTDGMSSALQGFRDAVILTLSTGYSLGVLCALTLNLILPRDAPAPTAIEELEQTTHDGSMAEKQVTEGKPGREESAQEDTTAVQPAPAPAPAYTQPPAASTM